MLSTVSRSGKRRIAIEMDEQAILGLNPNADAGFIQIENIYIENFFFFFSFFLT